MNAFCRRVACPLALALLVAVPGPALEIPGLGNVFGGGEEEVVAESADPTNKPGTREWWRKHKKKAVLVPRKGFQVEGFEGFFDSNGKPMDAAVDEISIKLTKQAEEEEGLIPGLDPKKHVASVKDALGMGPDQQAATEAMRQGIAHFNDKRYSQAADSFEEAANRWPGSDLAAKALFNLAQSYYYEDKYEQAADAYLDLLDKHPSTPRLNESIEQMWKIAQYWEEWHFAKKPSMPFGTNLTDGTRPRFDTLGHAIRVYEAIRLNDPTGPRADDAIMATANIHFRRGNHYDADLDYTLLRKEYPRSEHQFEAHLLGLQSKMKKYLGPDYDGTPLEEAKLLEERIRVNFRGRIDREEQERLDEVRAKLAAMLEARDLRMASYYSGTDHNASAKVYLRKVVDNNPNSPGAESARKQLADLEGEPDSPPTRLAWFVNLFPENKKFESINTIEEISPDAAQTMIADRSKEAAEGGTTTR